MSIGRGKFTLLGRGPLGQSGMLFALIALLLILMAISPAFRDPANLLNIGRQVVALGIVAFGLTFVIIAGEIDLSVGAVAGAAGVVAALALAAGWGFGGVIAGLSVGLGFGLLNGFLLIRAAVPSFIATLVTFFVAQGLARTLTGGGQTIVFDAPVFRDVFATASFVGIGSSLLWLVLALAVLAWLLSRTRYGANIYAIGGSQANARMLGLPVDRARLTAFALAGGLAGLAGLILIARIGNARADAAIGLEFDAIAAVVIGGSALGGGYGSIRRTLIGVLFIGVLNNALAILNVDFNSQQVVKGVLLVSAVLIDRWARTRVKT